jgi:hypothetical protein
MLEDHCRFKHYCGSYNPNGLSCNYFYKWCKAYRGWRADEIKEQEQQLGRLQRWQIMSQEAQRERLLRLAGRENEIEKVKKSSIGSGELGTRDSFRGDY